MSCKPSDYLPAKYDLPSSVAGDTFSGIGSFTISVNDEPPVNALSAVTMTFTKSDSLSASLVLNSNDGSLIIDDAATWTFHIPEFEITLDAGLYIYETKTVSISAQKRTYFEGTWKIS